MEYVFMFIGLVAVLFFGFIVGWHLAQLTASDNQTEIKASLQDLYCFECETEMPVKEKNGRLYCSNCKLYHN